jgi:hypothetical protein
VRGLGPNAHGEHLDPGRVADCTSPSLPAEHDGPGRVLVVAPRGLLHPAAAQPASSLLDELATGHRTSWSSPPSCARLAPATAALLTTQLAPVAAAVVGCWQQGDLLGFALPVEPGEDPRALVRPAMTLARAVLRARLGRLVARARCRWRHPSSGHHADEPFL